MNYKEKLKAIINSNKTPFVDIDTFLKYFPELKESEDEKIRKRLTEYFEGYYDGFATDRNHVNVHWEGLEVKEVLAWLEKQGEKKLVWSDDFEEEMDRYIEDNFYGSADNGFFSNRTKRELEVEDVIRIGCHFAAWQKEQSNKELSDKPKQEWSEEDEDKMQIIINIIKDSDPDWEELINWLKSLRPQNQWKPSGEQVEAFEHFVRSIGESGYACPYDNNTKLLYLLLSDLKKLKA